MHGNSEKSKKYHYRVYGLNVISDIILHELVPNDHVDEPEVEIVIGKVPEALLDVRETSEWFQTNNNEMLFDIDGTARYYVSHGNRIMIEPLDELAFSDVKLYMLGTAFAALLIQRGMYPLHGSAVVVDGKCIVIVGVSGAGKSTLCSSLRVQGCHFLTDDIVAISILTDGDVIVHPSYPQQKLWSDSAEKIGIDLVGLTKVSGDMDKYFIAANSGFINEACSLSAVFELKVEDTDIVKIEEITGAEKLTIIINNTYRAHLVGSFGLLADHFRFCASIVNRCQVYRITRPKNGFSLEDQIGLIRSELGKLSI